MVLPKSIAESDGKILSTTQVAERMDVHRSTVNIWIKTGMLPASKHGHFWGVRAKDLASFARMYEEAPK